MTPIIPSINADDASADDLLAMSILDDRLQRGASIDEALKYALTAYPHCADPIADYAIQVQSLGRAPRPPGETAQEDAATLRLVEQAISRMRPANQVALHSISSRLRAQSRLLADLARGLAVGESLLTKLDRGLIAASSIPAAFKTALANQLAVTEEALESILRRQPRLAAAADYKASRRPSPALPQPFRDALAASIAAGEISQAAAERWLNDSGT